MSQLSIVVADDETIIFEYIEHILQDLGHRVVGHAASGIKLVEICRELKPDLVITDIRMPGKSGIEAAGEIYSERRTPIIIVSAHHSRELAEWAAKSGVFSYLLKPIRRGELGAAVEIVMHRFHEFESLTAESVKLKNTMEERKIVERAKGSLMTRYNVDEQIAHKRLQRMAQDRRCKLTEAAEFVLFSQFKLPV